MNLSIVYSLIIIVCAIIFCWCKYVLDDGGNSDDSSD
jgi:hypothetical protein